MHMSPKFLKNLVVRQQFKNQVTMSDTNGAYYADELNPPDWLNKEFFTKILIDKNHDQSLKLTQFSITPATTKADHYASIMFRARLNFTNSTKQENSLAVIIKTTPIIAGFKKDLLEKFEHFETEIKMFAEILPKMEEMLREQGDETKLCANLLYSSLAPYKCLVFEDLCEAGYTNIKERHATMEEVKLALLKLAKIHATSYKLAKEGNEAITSCLTGSFCDSSVLEVFPFTTKAIKVIKDILIEQKDLAHFVPHFEKIEDKIFEKIFDTFNLYRNGKRDGIMVLNHGDFHMKNMMIKEQGEQLKDLMLLDYQISVFTTAAVDVIYATIMLFSPEMRLNQRDELIYYYFTNFQQTLKLIKYEGEIPKMLEFQQELLRHSHYELFLFVSFLVFNYVFAEKGGDLGKAVEDENYLKMVLSRPEVLREYRVVLPKFLYQGYFDF